MFNGKMDENYEADFEKSEKFEGFKKNQAALKGGKSQHKGIKKFYRLNSQFKKE